MPARHDHPIRNRHSSTGGRRQRPADRNHHTNNYRQLALAWHDRHRSSPQNRPSFRYPRGYQPPPSPTPRHRRAPNPLPRTIRRDSPSRELSDDQRVRIETERRQKEEQVRSSLHAIELRQRSDRAEPTPAPHLGPYENLNIYWWRNNTDKFGRLVWQGAEPEVQPEMPLQRSFMGDVGCDSEARALAARKKRSQTVPPVAPCEWRTEPDTPSQEIESAPELRVCGFTPINGPAAAFTPRGDGSRQPSMNRTDQQRRHVPESTAPRLNKQRSTTNNNPVGEPENSASEHRGTTRQATATASRLEQTPAVSSSQRTGHRHPSSTPGRNRAKTPKPSASRRAESLSKAHATPSHQTQQGPARSPATGSNSEPIGSPSKTRGSVYGNSRPARAEGSQHMIDHSLPPPPPMLLTTRSQGTAVRAAAPSTRASAEARGSPIKSSDGEEAGRTHDSEDTSTQQPVAAESHHHSPSNSPLIEPSAKAEPTTSIRDPPGPNDLRCFDTEGLDDEHLEEAFDLVNHLPESDMSQNSSESLSEDPVLSKREGKRPVHDSPLPTIESSPSPGADNLMFASSPQPSHRPVDQLAPRSASARKRHRSRPVHHEPTPIHNSLEDHVHGFDSITRKKMTTGDIGVYMVWWTRTAVPSHRIETRSNGTKIVRIGGREYGLDGVESMTDTPEERGLCMVYWTPTWEQEANLKTAEAALAAYHARAPLPYTPFRPPVIERIEAAIFRSQPEVDYRSAVRSYIETSEGDMSDVPRHFPVEADRRAVVFTRSVRVNINNQYNRPAILAYASGTRQTRPCECCQRKPRVMVLCVVDTRSKRFSGACTNCAYNGSRYHACNYHHERKCTPAIYDNLS